jgi:hypothetical protein
LPCVKIIIITIITSSKYPSLAKHFSIVFQNIKIGPYFRALFSEYSVKDENELRKSLSMEQQQKVPYDKCVMA